MLPRRVRVIRTSAGTVNGKPYDRLRIVLNLRQDQVERLGWEEGTEVEVLDHKDGLLLRRKQAT